MFRQVFRANWDGPLEAFKPVELSSEERRQKLIWDVVSVIIPIIGLWRVVEYAIGYLVSRVLLPSTGFDRERVKAAQDQMRDFMLDKQKHYKWESHQIQTPDGSRLNVQLVLNQRPGVEQFVICFNPRNAIAADMAREEWWYRESRQTPCHFVFFDYRGTGLSEGEFCSFKDLVIDGLSVVQWIQRKVGAYPEHIGFYGRDLGGALAVSVQLADPVLCKNWHVNDRSFSSVSSIVSSVFGDGLGLFLSWVLKRQGYGFDNHLHILDLPHRVVLHHPQDKIIPRAARYPGSVPMKPRLRAKSVFETAHHYASLDDCSKETLKEVRKVFLSQPGFNREVI